MATMWNPQKKNTEVSDDQEDGPEAEEIEEDITEDEVGVSDDEATEEA
jgi:hypothetical protein